MIDLRLARNAVALDRHRNFARAAAAVGVTQPTFSRNIAALERDLGVRLFDRTSRRVEPTEQGRLFLARAGTLLADAARLRQDLGDLEALHTGELVVGAGPYALEISVIETAARLAALHPAVRIDIIEGQWRESLPRLLSGDMAMIVSEAALLPDEPRLIAEPLPSRRGHFFCRTGHPLDGLRNLTLEQILEYPLVGTRLPSRVGAAFGASQAAGVIDPANGDFMPRIGTTSNASARALVKRTDGIGLATHAQIAEEIRRGALTLLDIEIPGLETRYGIARLRDRTPSAAATAFMKLLRQVEEEQAGKLDHLEADHQAMRDNRPAPIPGRSADGDK